jgi:hypothetical protein
MPQAAAEHKSARCAAQGGYFVRLGGRIRANAAWTGP